MIKKLHISGVHSQLTDEVSNYVREKIGKLERYVPKHARDSLHVEVKLIEKSAKDKRIHQCEVIMKLPKSTITVHKDSTSFIAAVDEAENNLKNQLKKYKDLHSRSRMSRHIIARFRGPIPQDTTL